MPHPNRCVDDIWRKIRLDQNAAGWGKSGQWQGSYALFRGARYFLGVGFMLGSRPF